MSESILFNFAMLFYESLESGDNGGFDYLTIQKKEHKQDFFYEVKRFQYEDTTEEYGN